uniref:Uncharacterized protein n=1 Tax=Lotus japonicus TaxID=34305 RepID=I3SV25_LOTJA|nr:unknown [Lotus japonicus]
MINACRSPVQTNLTQAPNEFIKGQGGPKYSQTYQQILYHAKLLRKKNSVSTICAHNSAYQVINTNDNPH